MPVDFGSLGPHDVLHVTPRYLAGPGEPGTATALAWPFLREGTWALHNPPQGYLLAASPCQRVKAGFTAGGPCGGSGHWATAFYGDPFALPVWCATWGTGTPVELIGAFHRDLAEEYTAGNLDALDPAANPAAGYLPLLNTGWAHQVDFHGDQMFTAPDQRASLLRFHQAQRGEQWKVTAGATGDSADWTAAFTARVPARLVAAFTTALAADAPLTRTVEQLPLAHRPYLTAEPATTSAGPAAAAASRTSAVAAAPPVPGAATRPASRVRR